MEESIGIATLLIERNHEMRANYRNLLAQCGINDVQPVATAAAAIRKLQERPFELIICEYHLGDGQDGQHLLEDMRIHRLIPLATVFIMVTGESSYERVVSAVELAPNDYILKPFAADTLFQRISRAFDKRDAFLKPYQLIEIGNLDAAVAGCVEGEQLFPQYAVDFLRLRAELLVALGRPEQAHEIYQRVIESRAVPWAKLGLAKTLFLQKQYPQAEEVLENLVAENKQYLDAYDWLARTHEASGQLQAAQRTLEEAVAFSPHTLRRLKKLGDIAMDNGDIPMAERTISEVVRKGKYSDFRDPEDHVKLVKVFVAKGDRSQAEKTIRDLNRSMQGMPKTEACSALSSAMVFTQAGEKDKAVEALNRAVVATRDDVGLSDAIKLDMVKTCLDNGQQQAAVDMMSEVMRNASDDLALDKAKQVFEKAGFKSMAEELALRAKQEVVDLVSAGAKQAQAGDYEGSVDFMLQAVRKMPGNIQVGLNAALALLIFIDHRGWNDKFAKQARKLIDVARQRDPANPRIGAMSEYFHNMLIRYGITPGHT